MRCDFVGFVKILKRNNFSSIFMNGHVLVLILGEICLIKSKFLESTVGDGPLL